MLWKNKNFAYATPTLPLTFLHISFIFFALVFRMVQTKIDGNLLLSHIIGVGHARGCLHSPSAATISAIDSGATTHSPSTTTTTSVLSPMYRRPEIWPRRINTVKLLSFMLICDACLYCKPILVPLLFFLTIRWVCHPLIIIRVYIHCSFP